jgi:hypothetical protein
MEQPKTSLRRSSPIGVVIVIAALIAAGFGAYRFWRRQAAPPPAESSAPTAAPLAPATGEPEPGAPIAPEQQQALLAAVSPNPLFRRAIALEDFVRRCAVAIDNLREGVSPRRPLDFLAPAQPFTVSRRPDGGLTAAPESYARYDAFADAVGSVDAAALARAYRALRPALREAYRALGYPDASLDDAVVRALRRIEAAPVVDGDLPVADAHGVYVLADAKLEGLPEVEKHLLRMGPRNTRLLQAKARELLAALDLHAAAGPQPQ